MKFTPEKQTRMSTWPVRSVGMATSRTLRTSRPPRAVICTAFNFHLHLNQSSIRAVRHKHRAAAGFGAERALAVCHARAAALDLANRKAIPDTAKAARRHRDGFHQRKGLLCFHRRRDERFQLLFDRNSNQGWPLSCERLPEGSLNLFLRIGLDSPDSVPLGQ